MRTFADRIAEATYRPEAVITRPIYWVKKSRGPDEAPNTAARYGRRKAVRYIEYIRTPVSVEYLLGDMSSVAWPFDQPPNCAVLTTRSIAFDGAPFLLVARDADDHGWQFLGLDGADESKATVLALQEIVQLDSSVLELANLPPCSSAWRESQSAPWQRSYRTQ